jgi:hypothetical protein
MKLFGCRGCDAHQAHINSLLSEIESLRKLVYPSSTSNDATVDNIEANAVLNGHQDIITIASDKEQEFIETQYEADRILSGNY